MAQRVRMNMVHNFAQKLIKKLEHIRDTSKDDKREVHSLLIEQFSMGFSTPESTCSFVEQFLKQFWVYDTETQKHFFDRNAFKKFREKHKLQLMQIAGIDDEQAAKDDLVDEQMLCDYFEAMCDSYTINT